MRVQDKLDYSINIIGNLGDFFQISETGGESFAPWFDISTKNRIRRKKLSNQLI